MLRTAQDCALYVQIHFAERGHRAKITLNTCHDGKWSDEHHHHVDLDHSGPIHLHVENHEKKFKVCSTAHKRASDQSPHSG